MIRIFPADKRTWKMRSAQIEFNVVQHTLRITLIMHIHTHIHKVQYTYIFFPINLKNRFYFRADFMYADVRDSSEFLYKLYSMMRILLW